MGSGHFLVAAIDRIEKRFSTYLAEIPIPDVTNELARLRQLAKEVMKEYGESLEIDDTQLLRRQIARRCIYGIDLNQMAVDLARLSIWVHTFVPGLPLSLLDYNLVCGNSLVGIATIQEAEDILAEGYPLWSFNAMSLLGDAQDQLDKIARLADADASQIKEAREAYDAARHSLKPSAALFDILAASRLDARLQKQMNEGELVNWIADEARHELPDSQPHQIAKEALKSTPPFHFPIAFPQVFLRERAGFDVILGNPPWKEATLEEDRFWTRYVPGLQGMRQHEQEDVKAEWRALRPDLVTEYEKEHAQVELLRRVLVTGPFPGMGTGNPDLYKGFVWRFWALINDSFGRMGVVLPRSVFSAKGGSGFRQEMFTAGKVEDMTHLVNNSKWVFEDVHAQYTVTLVCLRKHKSDAELMLPMRGPFSSRRNFDIGTQAKTMQFPIDAVFTWTNTAALPLLPDDFATEVFAQLRKSPNLGLDDKDSWRTRPYRELDATNDKKYMEVNKDPDPQWWPVYKGESFNHWEPDTGIYYAWAKPDQILDRLCKKRCRSSGRRKGVFYGFPKEWVEDKTTYPSVKPRICVS